jgi:hypothetical protein
VATSDPLEGVADLRAKLGQLARGSEMTSALRAAVRDPMKKTVLPKARDNLAAISPGKTPLHKTYRGRLVAAGFAARSLKVVVRANRVKTVFSALLGVAAEAFYALQFFELGTAFIPAHPWLVPAFESSQDIALRQVAATLRKAVERIAKKRAKEFRA